MRFGRYSDTFKEPVKYKAWEAALTHYEKDEYEDAYKCFFQYLRDEREDNVHWADRPAGGIKFEILQGSKKIVGEANARQIKAEARIVHARELNLGLLRRLVEANYALDYGRFALDPENNLVIKFDSSTVDGSPYKLYYALKEVALQADKQDDLLLEEFGDVLTSVDSGVETILSDDIKEKKYHYILAQIEAVFKEIDGGKLSVEKHAGGFAYLLLNLIYKLDYLTKPEGFIMDALEKAHQAYFSKDRASMLQKVSAMRKILTEILNRDPEAAKREMYDVVSTFGLSSSKGHDVLADMIEKELPQMDWYDENRHEDVAASVPGYIVGYNLFNYALPRPDKDALDMYYRITEPAYFASLGFEPLYADPVTGALNPKTIKAAIRQIADQNRNKYPKLAPETGMLVFDRRVAFARSYLLMVKLFDLSLQE